MPPSEYVAWAEMSGAIVYPHEYAIMQEMDKVFCEETNKELAALRERQAEADRIAAGKK